MTEKDVSWGTYFEDKERFADFVNCFGCDGEQCVCDEDVHTEDTREWLRVRFSGKREGVNRIRDTVRRVIFGVNCCIIGIENQESIDYAYPLRELSYTLGTYEKQRRQIARRIRKMPAKLKSTSELLYGFGKNDKLSPSVTFLLYAGGTEWDGSKDLHGILDFEGIPKALRKRIHNYEVNLIEIRKLSEEQIRMLKTDLRNVFGFIKCADDKDALLNLVENDSYYKSMDEEAYMVVANYTNSKELIESEKYVIEEGKRNMCKAIKDLIADGRREGLAAGHAEGRVEGRAEGQVEGRMISLQESIVEFLTEHGEVDQDLQKQIFEQKDEQILRQWTKKAVQVNSVEEFKKVI